jgi:DNA-binding transcriptional regulator PaaX
MPGPVHSRAGAPAPPAAAESLDEVGPTLRRRDTVGAALARSLLLTVLGEYVLPSARPVWTSALVRVMAGLGVEETSARQALARTAADGWVAPSRDGRRVWWGLTAPGRRLLTDGAERIYSFAAAPGHVAYVRHLVVDNLSTERLRRLGQDAERILQRIDSPAR